MKSFSIFLLLFIGLNTWLSAQNIPKKPEPARYMVDNAAMLSAEDAQSIEDKLYGYYKDKGPQIVVVTVVDLQGATVEIFAERLFYQWGIGDKKRNDGILLLISKNDRKMRIEVGYGLESTITDAVAANIISDKLTPQFKNSQFDQGIELAVREIIKKISPDYTIPISQIDSLKAVAAAENAAKQQIINQERAERQAVLDKEAAIRRAAKWRIFWYIVLALLACFLLFIALQRYARRVEAKEEKFSDLSSRCQSSLNKCKEIKALKAYAELPFVKEFVDTYTAALQKIIAKLAAYQDLEAASSLIFVNNDSLDGYFILAEAYQKTTTSELFPNDKYYPEEVARFVQRNIRELTALSSPEKIRFDHRVIKSIGQQPPSYSISAQISARLATFGGLGKNYDLAKKMIVSPIEDFEKTADFQALIAENTQSRVEDTAPIVAMNKYANQVILVLEQLKNVVDNIEKIAIHDPINLAYKAPILETAKAHCTTILKRLKIPFSSFYNGKLRAVNRAILKRLEIPFSSQIDAQLIADKLADKAIQAEISGFYIANYSQIFKEMCGIISDFNHLETLLNKYQATYTVANINRMHTSITAALTRLNDDFEAKKITAFTELVEMFNGIFGTSVFLNRHLTYIPMPTVTYYTAPPRSSYSDYKPPYSDYKPPYSDYKPPYSDYKDYSDYSDSSYGGGSSGGGGASGGW